MASSSDFNAADACAYPADAWYLADSGDDGFPSDFMQCLDNGAMYPKCADCACRQLQSVTDSNGTVLSFVECIILSDGATCSATSCSDGSGASANDTIAPAATTAAPAMTTPTPTTTAPVATTAAPAMTTVPATTTAAPAATTTAPTATIETPVATVTAAETSASSGESSATASTSPSYSTPSSSGSDSYNDWSDSSDTGKSVSTGSSSSSSSTKTVLAAIVIGAGVLLVALLCLWLRSYCKKRAARTDKAFDGVTTTTAQRTPAFPPAFGGMAGQEPTRFPPNSDRARAASRARSNSRTTARSTPRSTPQSTPIIAPIMTSSSNGSSHVSGDSRSTRSSGGSVFSAAVTNNGAVFMFNSARQQTADSRSRRARNIEPRPTRSTVASAVSSAAGSSEAYSSRRAPPQSQYDIPETKWSVYSEERDRSTVGRGMSSMISDYSDIDWRSTRLDDRDTAASAMSFFSDDSEFDRETTASQRHREREF